MLCLRWLCVLGLGFVTLPLTAADKPLLAAPAAASEASAPLKAAAPESAVPAKADTPLISAPAKAGIPAEVDDDEAQPKGNQVLFVGMDISGSFKNTPYYDDSIQFMAHYIFAHVHGLGGLKVITSLFVGSIGGAKVGEPKTFYPIQTFQYKSVPQIEAQLREIFPPKVTNKFTDFNAYFEQVATFMKNKKLLMKSTDIVLLTDGIPDAPTAQGKTNFRMLNLKPFENLSRKITLRVLYTSAQTGMSWQTEVPRKRLRVWTQDAQVMKGWKAADIYLKDLPIEKQERWFSWVKENVDFPVKPIRVN